MLEKDVVFCGVNWVGLEVEEERMIGNEKKVGLVG